MDGSFRIRPRTLIGLLVDLAPVWLTRRRRRGDKERQVEINLRIK
jgi:hypothetical protein